MKVLKGRPAKAHTANQLISLTLTSEQPASAPEQFHDNKLMGRVLALKYFHLRCLNDSYRKIS
jgi:hypothetical protein